jgi:hypothetical protein
MPDIALVVRWIPSIGLARYALLELGWTPELSGRK